MCHFQHFKFHVNYKNFPKFIDEVNLFLFVIRQKNIRSLFVDKRGSTKNEYSTGNFY